MENQSDKFKEFFNNYIQQKDFKNYDGKVIAKNSEESYRKTSERIVDASIDELKIATEYGRIIKTVMIFSIILFVGISIMTLYIILFFDIKNNIKIIVPYLTIFMIEIVTCIITLQKLVFDDKYQSGIISTLHKYLENYKIYRENEEKITKNMLDES